MATLQENTEIPSSGLPTGLTLHLVPGTFQVVRLDPNTSKRLIVWREPDYCTTMLSDDKEVETTMQVEGFAGQNCVAAIVTGAKTPFDASNTILLGLKNLDTGEMVNEQDPLTLRLLSSRPARNKQSSMPANLHKFVTAGVPFLQPKPVRERLREVGSWALGFTLLMLLALSIDFTRMRNTFNCLVTLMVSGLLYLTVLLVMMVDGGHIYSSKEAQSLARSIVDQLNEEGQFEQAAQEAENHQLRDKDRRYTERWIEQRPLKLSF